MSDPVTDEAIDLTLARLETDEGAIDRLHVWAYANLRIDPKAVEAVLARAEAIAEERSYARAMAWVRYFQGWLLHDRAEYEQAMALHLHAALWFDGAGDLQAYSRACNGVGSDYQFLGDYESSIKWLSRAFEAAEKIQDSRQAGVLYSNLAGILFQLSRYDEARELCGKALARTDASLQTLILTKVLLGSIAVETGRSADARPLVAEARQLAREGGLESFECDVSSLEASIESAEGNIDRAVALYEKAMAVALESGEPHSLAEQYLHCGDALMAAGRAGAALERFRKGIEMARHIKARYLEYGMSRAAAEACKLLGEWKNACEFMTRRSELERDLFADRVTLALLEFSKERDRREEAIYHDMYDRISAIGEIGREITSRLDLESVVETVFASVDKLVGADVLGMAHYDADAAELRFASFVDRGRRVDGASIKVDDPDSLAAWTIRNRAEVVLSDADAESGRYVKRSKMAKSFGEIPQSVIFLPLFVRGEPVGLITVQSFRKNAYDERQVESIRALAPYVAIGLENARLYARLERAAMFDALTGLLNRSQVMAAGEREFYRLRRYGSAFSVVMFDLDDFKAINNSFGHDAGDRVLRAVSASIGKVLRSSDSGGRYGGEEFLLVLPETDEAGALILAERLRQDIAEDTALSDGEWRGSSTASIGVYTFRGDEASFEAGISLADQAMYESKRAGKNRVTVYGAA